MNTYFIVTQADIDEKGHFLYPNAIFSDDNGNTQLCINGEEARQLLAEDVAAMCGDVATMRSYGTVAINGGECVRFEPADYEGKEDAFRNRIIEYVLQNMKPDSGQYVEISYDSGSKRNYTINSITI